jgi:uncharacterized protein YhbP (UPF0306 family)
VAIERSQRRFAARRLHALTAELLEASSLCAISTVSGSRAHVNTAYFAWSDSPLELVWLSDPAAEHSRNLRRNPAAAVAVYDSRQTWGRPDRGIQLFGSARVATRRAAARAASVYAGRFSAYEPAEMSEYRLYEFRPRRIKLFHERALGTGVFVTARVVRGELEWARTEVYKSAVDRAHA